MPLQLLPTAHLPRPATPDINEGKELLENVGWPATKQPDALLPNSISLLRANSLRGSRQHAGIRPDIFMSSTRLPLTAELFSLEFKDLAGHTTILPFDLQQQLPGHSFVGDLVPFWCAVHPTTLLGCTYLLYWAAEPLRFSSLAKYG